MLPLVHEKSRDTRTTIFVVLGYESQPHFCCRERRLTNRILMLKRENLAIFNFVFGGFNLIFIDYTSESHGCFIIWSKVNLREGSTHIIPSIKCIASLLTFIPQSLSSFGILPDTIHLKQSSEISGLE